LGAAAVAGREFVEAGAEREEGWTASGEEEGD